MMGISIKSKIICNDLGFVDNNKTKPASVVIEVKRIAKQYDELGVVILKPHIDRIVLGFFISQAMLDQYHTGVTVEELNENVKALLYGDAMYGEESGLKPVKNISFFKKPFCDYKVNLEFRPKPDSVPMLIHAGAKSAKHPMLKLSLNPSHYSLSEMKRLHALLGDLFTVPGGIPYVDLIKGAFVHRADIAVEILGVQPCDVEVMLCKGNEWVPHKRHVYLSKRGKAETIYPKAASGKSSQEYVYDKRQELIDTKRPPMFGDVLHTRFEARVTKSTMSKLPNLKNRCKRVSIRAVNYKSLRKKSLTQQLFIGFALASSLEIALRKLPNNKSHAKYTAAYNSVVTHVWPSELIWAHWKDAIKATGLLP